MPGPLWKHRVGEVGSDIENCRQKMDALLGGDDGGPSRQEVFRNANTVVEVSVKTLKPENRVSEKKGSPRRVTKAKRSPERKVVRRTTVVERLTRDEAEKAAANGVKSVKRDKNDSWAMILSDSENKVPPRPGKTKKDRRSHSSGDAKREDELKKQLRESQSRCAEKDKLIADLKQAMDRMATNNNNMVTMLEGKVALEETLTQLKEENVSLQRALTSNKSLLSSMATKLAKMEMENANLKKIISGFQSSLEVDLAKRRSARPTPSPASELLPEVPSVPDIADVIDGRRATAVGGKRAFTPIGESGSLAISFTSDDSAVEDLSSRRSNPSSKSTPPVPATSSKPTVPQPLAPTKQQQQQQQLQQQQLQQQQLQPLWVPSAGEPLTNFAQTKTDAIISDARSLLGQIKDKQTTSKPTIPAKKSPVPVPVAASSQQTAKNGANGGLPNLEGEMQKFLERMKAQAPLDFTLPDLPPPRSFHSALTSGAESDGNAHDVSTVVDGGALAAKTLDVEGTLSETKFRQGLEASLFYTSADEKESANLTK